jgi:uncharacterized membrane protein YgcG
MKLARPDVTEERWLTLALRYPALRAAVERSGGAGPWKTTTWLGRCVGFMLALVGIAMLWGVLRPFGAPLLVGGVLLVAGAEWLMAKRRLLRSGIEEAMSLCGALGITGQFLAWSDGNDAGAGLALLCATGLFAGWRLLNPLFTTLACAGFSIAIALARTQLFDGRLNARAAAIACAVAAIAALVLGARQWRRPAHDRMLGGLVIAMPWLACAWLVMEPRAERAAAMAGLATALVFLAATLVAGLRRRDHAPLIGAVGNLAWAGYFAHELVRWPLHWLLIAAGGSVLAVALLVERRLRDREAGLTSRALAEPEGMDLLQAAAIAQATGNIGARSGSGLAPEATPPAAVEGQGGGFGGGGASGRY